MNLSLYLTKIFSKISSSTPESEVHVCYMHALYGREMPFFKKISVKQTTFHGTDA